MAYLADALAALLGSMLGVSTVATFAESTAGGAGGRVGGTKDRCHQRCRKGKERRMEWGKDKKEGLEGSFMKRLIAKTVPSWGGAFDLFSA